MLRCKQVDGVPRRAIRRQIGHDVADLACKLEAVAEKASGDGDLRIAGMRGDDEVLIGRVGVHARDSMETRTVQRRHTLRHSAAHALMSSPPMARP